MIRLINVTLVKFTQMRSTLFKSMVNLTCVWCISAAMQGWARGQDLPLSLLGSILGKCRLIFQWMALLCRDSLGHRCDLHCSRTSVTQTAILPAGAYVHSLTLALFPVAIFPPPLHHLVMRNSFDSRS